VPPSELTLFSYEILGLVGRDGAGPHDLRRMIERGRLLAWAGESRYYSEPKRLAALGYLKARKEAGRTRERTVYSLTAKGRRALAVYARRPVELPPIKSDAMVRLLVCDLVGEPATRAGIATLRAELDDAERRLDEAEAAAAALPHRQRYLLLGSAFMRRIVAAHRALVDDVERELSAT
jgi:DNA-binding PadR family transcriptional regulator